MNSLEAMQRPGDRRKLGCCVISRESQRADISYPIDHAPGASTQGTSSVYVRARSFCRFTVRCQRRPPQMSAPTGKGRQRGLLSLDLPLGSWNRAFSAQLDVKKIKVCEISLVGSSQSVSWTILSSSSVVGAGVKSGKSLERLRMSPPYRYMIARSALVSSISETICPGVRLVGSEFCTV